eukprot:g36247.t1
MVSFDITALFTSVDIPLARETVATLLKERDPSNTISTDNMLKLLDLYLMTYFTFNGQIYEQIIRAPMGSPISRLIAEAVMQRLESMALPEIQPRLWIQYVDDTFVILKWTKLEETHQLINNTLTGIKFTREGERTAPIPRRHGRTQGQQGISNEGQTKQRQAREFLEAWFSTKKTINKQVELDSIYTPLRIKPEM